MGRDFYKILGVSRNATEEDLKKAYKKQALKWHPDRVAPDKKDEAQAKFQEIGEAFDTLSDPEKKRIYDQVGEDGLKMGAGGAEGGEGGSGGSGDGSFSSGGRTFHFSQSGMPGGSVRANDIFRQFFGTSDPFAADDDDIGFMMGGGSRGGMSGGFRPQQQIRQQPLQKSEPVNHTLFLTLEELYTGTTKRMRITKKVLDASGQTMQVASEKVIDVKAGWKNGTKITFACEGDEKQGYIAADVVFTIQAKKHDRFTREGDDLHYTHTLGLEEALVGADYTVTTLDNRVLRIHDSNITPQSEKLVPGEGMVNSKKMTRGDLRIRYNIVFPPLTSAQRDEIRKVLSSARR